MSSGRLGENTGDVETAQDGFGMAGCISDLFGSGILRSPKSLSVLEGSKTIISYYLVTSRFWGSAEAIWD